MSDPDTGREALAAAVEALCDEWAEVRKDAPLTRFITDLRAVVDAASLSRSPERATAGEGLRAVLRRPLSDPGSVCARRDDASLPDWQLDAVMHVLAALPAPAADDAPRTVRFTTETGCTVRVFDHESGRILLAFTMEQPDDRRHAEVLLTDEEWAQLVSYAPPVPRR